MQTPFAAFIDAGPTTVPPSPKASTPSTGSEQTFATHLQKAADTRTLRHQSTDKEKPTTLEDGTDVTSNPDQIASAGQHGLNENNPTFQDPDVENTTVAQTRDQAVPSQRPVINGNRLVEEGMVQRMLGTINEATASASQAGAVADSVHTSLISEGHTDKATGFTSNLDQITSTGQHRLNENNPTFQDPVDENTTVVQASDQAVPIQLPAINGNRLVEEGMVQRMLGTITEATVFASQATTTAGSVYPHPPTTSSYQPLGSNDAVLPTATNTATAATSSPIVSPQSADIGMKNFAPSFPAIELLSQMQTTPMDSHKVAPSIVPALSTVIDSATTSASPLIISDRLTNAIADNASLATATEGITASRDLLINAQVPIDNRTVRFSSAVAGTIVFNTANASPATSAVDGATMQPEPDNDPTAPFVVQNKYGQIITIQQSTAAIAASTLPGAAAGSLATLDGQTITVQQNGAPFAATTLPGATADSRQTIEGQTITVQQNASPVAATTLPGVTADSRQTIEGQTITVQAAATSLVGAPGGIQPTANTPARNINDAYIHAHLPSNAAIKAETSTDNSLDDSAQGQSTGENGFSQNIDKQAVAEQILTFKGLAASATESQPFLFNHQQAGSQSGAMPLPLESSMYRLASGLPVPEGTVTDQIIAHFSANKRLESGSVNLKLYPQELGELRMEIKVDQDNVKAHIIAQSPQAQEMIDRHMPRLREALEQQGLHLQHIEVSVATQDNGANERFQDNGARRQAAHGLASSNSPNLFEDQLEEELDIQAQLDSNLSVIA